MIRPRPKRRRRRFLQFSLRTLLAFVLLVSVGMSWFAAKLEKARRQKKLVNKYELEWHWDVLYDYEVAGLRDPESVEWRFVEHPFIMMYMEVVPPVPAWLQNWLGIDFFADVHAITVYDDIILTHRPGFHFPGCYDHTDADFDAALRHLTTVEGLQGLCIQHSKLTDSKLLYLREVTQLRTVCLDYSPITDAGLKYLESMADLQELSLRFTDITDTGLVHLNGLKNLERIDLSDTQVTPEGVKKLQEALPECEIVYSP